MNTITLVCISLPVKLMKKTSRFYKREPIGDAIILYRSNDSAKERRQFSRLMQSLSVGQSLKTILPYNNVSINCSNHKKFYNPTHFILFNCCKTITLIHCHLLLSNSAKHQNRVPYELILFLLMKIHMIFSRLH